MKEKSFIALLLISLSVYTAFGQQYQRVVSLTPSLTKNIYYLGAEDKLVGCTSFCPVDDNDNISVVANAVKVNLEKVVSLKPDLVIYSTLTNSETIESIKKFGIKTYGFGRVSSYDELCKQFIQLGVLVDKENESKQIIEESRHQVDSIISKSKLNKPFSIFFQIGTNPIFSVVPDTYMNDFITFFGASNIAHDVTSGLISRESVVARNPDYIFIVTMGVLGEEEKENWNRFSNMSAVKNKQIYVIDADMACSPTPIDFTNTIVTIDNLLDKE